MEKSFQGFKRKYVNAGRNHSCGFVCECFSCPSPSSTSWTRSKKAKAVELSCHRSGEARGNWRLEGGHNYLALPWQSQPPGSGSQTQTAAEPPDPDLADSVQSTFLSFLKASLRSLQADAHRGPPDNSQCPDGKTEACKGKGTLPEGLCWSGLLTHPYALLSPGPWLGPAHWPPAAIPAHPSTCSAL